MLFRECDFKKQYMSPSCLTFNENGMKLEIQVYSGILTYSPYK